MTSVARVWSAVLLLLVAGVTPLAVAQQDELSEAVKLFEQQEYEAAQEVLLKIDRSALTEDELESLDQLLDLTLVAIKATERVRQALAEADKAYAEGDWERADQNYRTVEESGYAKPAQREFATAQRERIAEKRSLVDAAKPDGTVEEGVVVVVEDVDDEQAAPEEAEPATEPMEPIEAAPEEAPAEAPADEPGMAMEDAPADVEEGPRRLTPVEEMMIADRLRWQRAVVRAQSLADKARDAIEAQDFDDAMRLADSALQVIEGAAPFAERVEVYEAEKQKAQRLKEEVRQSSEEFQREMAQQERAEIKERIETRRRILEQQKQETVQQLFNSAEQLRRERRFSEAAEALRQVLRIDPGNVKARYQLDIVEDYESFTSQAADVRTRHAEQRHALQKADQSLIPWDYDVLYPKNWPELTANRRAQGVQQGAALEDIELNRKLDETLPEVRFEETPFEQVVDFLVELTELNISVDWTDLNDALLMPAREKPVTVALEGLKARTVLKEILSQVGGDTELSFAVGDGLIRVATKEKLDRDKFILIYDVRDLLATVPSTGRPDFQQQNQGLGQQGGGGGQSVFGTQNQQNQQDQQDQVGGQAEMERLKEIIRQTVEPDSWVEAGAGPGGGSIQDLNGQLLIYNTSDAHRQVVDLLSQLRETQALQVSVEARFLDVTANFLEQFGVDLDFVFNAGSAGYDRATDLVDPFTGAPILIPRQFSRIGSVASTPAFGQPMAQNTPLQPYAGAAFVPPRGGVAPHIDEMTPISAQQGSLSLVEPSGINTAVPGSWAQRSALQPALNITGSFLDNIQVDFLIRATQANQRSTIVQAPRAVLTNGQAVEIRIESLRRYISSLEPVVGENAALPRPIPEDATAGISMWVQAVISADRRYSKLSIALLQQGEPEFERYELQRGSGNSPSIFLLLPRFSRITYTTTVSVPDGGTVLLGGFKQVGEVEVEAGVPILSKIPILKRAFTNQTTVKDTRTLLILVKSKILIQQEAEEQAFPTFTNAGA